MRIFGFNARSVFVVVLENTPHHSIHDVSEARNEDSTLLPSRQVKFRDTLSGTLPQNNVCSFAQQNKQP